MTIKDRIFQIIDLKRITINALERQMGVSNSYFKNTKNISAENCAKLLDIYPDISAEWLLLGKGEMLKNNQNVGDITNSSVTGVNINGTEIHLPSSENVQAIMDMVVTYQRITEKQLSQIDQLIAIIKSKI